MYIRIWPDVATPILSDQTFSQGMQQNTQNHLFVHLYIKIFIIIAMPTETRSVTGTNIQKPIRFVDPAETGEKEVSAQKAKKLMIWS